MKAAPTQLEAGGAGGPPASSTRPVSPRFLDEAKSLACIHCGLCLSSCPTYLETGNENDSPRGRIYLMRAVQEGRLGLDHPTVRHIDLCLGCRACEATCPSGVQYGELLEETRAHVEANYPRSAWQTFLRRVAIEQVFPFPARMKLALWAANIPKALRVERFLPKFLAETLSLLPDNFDAASLPALSPAALVCGADLRSASSGGSASTSLGPGLQSKLKPADQSSARPGQVGFISGCVMSVMFGKTNTNSVKLLNRAGYDVLTPKRQVCCGALYAHTGQIEKARECARKNIEAFEDLGVEAVIINAAGCGSTLKEYHRLLLDDAAWRDRARAFSTKVKDLTEWLTANQFRVPNSELRAPASEHSAFGTQHSALPRVTYHDACHLAHAQRITKPPRELVRAAAGARFVELPESDVCCGSAGSYNLTEPEMANRLQRRKIENILTTGAQVVVTTNPGCMLQIRAGLQKAGAGHIRVLHIADFLEERTQIT